MTTTWTAVFTLDGSDDTPADQAASLNGMGGAAIQRALRPGLTARGWPIDEAGPEDHGWHATGRIEDAGKPLDVAVVIAPDEDAAAASAWRIVLGLDLGLFGGTRPRRTALLRRLAADAEAALRDLGARDVEWQVGGP
jgi:hypothetical protein